MFEETCDKIERLETCIAKLEKERDAAIAERDAAQVTLVNFRMDELEPALNQVDDLRAERDGLRRAIEAAPHWDCWVGLQGRECNCWKSRALAAVPAPAPLPK